MMTAPRTRQEAAFATNRVAATRKSPQERAKIAAMINAMPTDRLQLLCEKMQAGQSAAILKGKSVSEIRAMLIDFASANA